MVKLVQHRPIPDGHVIKSATVSQALSGKYFVSLLLEYESAVQVVNPKSFIGLHFSVPELYRDSNGNEPHYPKFHTKLEDKIKREQRKLSRMQKGSHNYEKQRIRLARVYEKIANQRKDFLHRRSRRLANNYDCVCIEDANIKELMQSSDDAKTIQDESWTKFTGFLDYKLRDQGKKFIKLNKDFNSVQICSICGYKNVSDFDLTIRAWDCPNCGTHHDRDANAAINIMNEGKRLVALASASKPLEDQQNDGAETQ